MLKRKREDKETASSTRGSKNNEEVLNVSIFEIIDLYDNDLRMPLKKRFRRLVIKDESSKEKNITPKWNGS